MANHSLPQKPELQGTTLLSVFTHPSLRIDGQHVDNSRYTELGETALAAAVSVHFFHVDPPLSAIEISNESKQVLTDEKLAGWAQAYNLIQNLRYLPSTDLDVRSPKEARSLFSAYAGGVLLQHGPAVLNAWISHLIDPNSAHKITSQQRHSSPVHANGRAIKAEEQYIALNQRPVTPSSSNGSIQKQKTYLPLVNQMASQQHIAIEYIAESSGPPHSLTWVIQCIVDGQVVGSGRGGNKQAAKEQAAKMAFHSLGWGEVD
ncbi:hypothetical protein SISNIDRAFT_547959 [Sistotremastrum niveocremeum HHB9708]|uniref:Uncharacterized protein n=2 Tax=Sistotremastraceae TaxID=3402574 RepID=A0A164XAL1_9AGAM|nr:hypothetical protein SISNIDRAFT_547959 [Sistotremastrum niveocremeum HHB9708]KZT35638.1 hypothetical protein SISSUDRAFT_1130971 [Sistotremastrum suecicum HHB10207 ss-3]